MVVTFAPGYSADVPFSLIEQSEKDCYEMLAYIYEVDWRADDLCILTGKLLLADYFFPNTEDAERDWRTMRRLGF